MIGRVLQIAASTRVLRELRWRALERSDGVVLGLELVNLRALAERCAAETDVAVRGVLGSDALARAVEVCARQSPRFGPLVAERPGLAHALSGTLRDLRDAGVPPDALPHEVADLRALYVDVERALAQLADDGLVDRVGLFRIAARGAHDYVRRGGFVAAQVHGATELVGSAGDLIDAIAAALPSGGLRFFQPDWGDAHAERLRAEWAWQRFVPEAVEVVEHPALTRDGVLPEGALRILRAPSPREEIELVAREVLALLESGVPPHEIQVVARALEPCSPWLETVFDGYGIPVASSLARPAIAVPAARAWLDLVHALTRDLPRAPVVRLLEHACAREVGVAIERVGRRCAVVSGEADWRAALAASRLDAERVQAPLERLFAARRAFAHAPSFAAGVRAALDAADALLPGTGGIDGECRAALEQVAQLDQVDRAASAAGAPESATLGAALERTLLELSIPWHDEDSGGVRVLDAVQARAVPCDHLFLIGAVHGAWPRDLADDPFLPDRVRRQLRTSLHRPVPLRGSVGAEDRSLFGLLLAQTRERVNISWAERDAQGRTLSPSALLRNLPFVAPGTDVADAKACSADTDFARTPSEQTGHEALAAGHAQLACIDDAQGSDLSFDGAVGAAALPALGALAPTFLESLGRCALRAFFDHVLRARELEHPGPAGLDDAESGRFVHAALDQLYTELAEQGALRPQASAATAREAAERLLPAALERAAAELRGDMQKRHPRIFEAYLDAMAASIRDFLKRDLDALLPQGAVAIESEREVSARIDVGGGAALDVEGRIDRIVQRPDGSLRVGDYKTGSFKKQLAKLEILRGRSLQLPLYTLAVAQSCATDAVSAEVLPVPRHPQRDRDEARSEERSLPLSDLETLSQPALAELERLLARGDFPFRSDELGCAHCPHTIACRYAQPESEARSRAAQEREAYFALQERRL